MGNTPHSVRLCIHSSVHPHTRGEYLTRQPRAWASLGSPPHAWGILRMPSPIRRSPRFTPTRVGNTGAGCVRASAGSVHPHTRGEYWRARRTTKESGSPPHAWGIPQRGRCVHALPGSPPHAWGIQGSLVRVQVDHGSPPHAWGIRARPALLLLPVRFTPTRVGNTGSVSTAHMANIGSPPHAWGIRRSCRLAPSWNRFTPTRVGNTAPVQSG